MRRFSDAALHVVWRVPEHVGGAEEVCSASKTCTVPRYMVR